MLKQFRFRPEYIIIAFTFGISASLGSSSIWHEALAADPGENSATNQETGMDRDCKHSKAEKSLEKAAKGKKESSASSAKLKKTSKRSADGSEIPSEFDSDKSLKFDEEKWRKYTEQGMSSLEKKRFHSAEACFQAAVREASKAPCMSTFMIDSLVHTAEVCKETGRSEEARDYFDQALALVGILKADKCPLCESSEDSVPVIYGPHSNELDEWVKNKTAQLGDFKAVTQKGRKMRPAWYCKTCDQAY